MEEWETLCARCLPIVPKNSIWRYNRAVSPDDRDQGWKIHISATILSASKVLRTVSPLLARSGVLFKAPRSLRELKRLNCGLFYGFEQIGKVITIYPKSDHQAASLARKLDKLTAGMPGPAVPFDFQLRKNSKVHYRFGAFRARKHVIRQGKRLSTIMTPDGELVPDFRGASAAVPSWTKDPFRKRDHLSEKIPRDGPLGTTILAYEVISRRGRGGVYRALDLSVSPARLCVLKEGKAHGETGFDGRDGYWRVTQEERVLSVLRSVGVEVPRVYDSFKAGNNYYLVLELIEGKTLNSFLLEQRARLSISEALRYGVQLSNLLRTIHDAGWVWRDCKPLNLLLCKEGTMRPLDFEGACPVGLPDMTPWGTEGYIPPEWLEDATEISRLPQDLFALGAILHQLFTARIPDRTYPVPPIGRLRKKVPTQIRETIDALLDPNPKARPHASFVSRVFESFI
jgi:class IV lanthipeptide synthase